MAHVTLCSLSRYVHTLLGVPPADAGDARDTGSSPGWGRSPGGGSGSPVQCSCRENSMDGGASWATCSPRGCRESDTTEHTHSHTHSSGPATTGNAGGADEEGFIPNSPSSITAKISTEQGVKSVTERETSSVEYRLYLASRKRAQIKLFAKQKQRYRRLQNKQGYQGGRGRGQVGRLGRTCTHRGL